MGGGVGEKMTMYDMGREGIKKCHFESDVLLYFLNEPSEALLISLMLITGILNTVDVRLGSKYASGHVSFAAKYWKHQSLYISPVSIFP